MSTPTVLVPGLYCTPRCFEAQTRALWSFGPVTVADHRRDDSVAAIARRLLVHAPPTFALAGISMGGYVALEVMRQAPERVTRLALLCTSARPDTDEQTDRRKQQIELAKKGRLAEVAKLSFPLMVHPSRHGDEGLRDAIRSMAEQTGADTFVRQQTAIIGRPDSRPHLSAIRCPTLVLAAGSDEVIPAEWTRELADGIPGAKLETLSDCGHLATLDQPEATARLLSAFWSGG